MFKQCYCNWWWRLGLLLSLTFITNTKVLAEVTADKTLGTQVTDDGLNSFIEAGTTVNNTNLFHSFSSFNIPNGGAAVFLNQPNIVNIFARVTGGTPSDIQGLIYAQGIANLFLMNPNGIIFGKNARLNIGGSFVTTTANAIQFPGGAEFSLTSPVAPENTLLSVNPTAFLFNQIANQGTNSIENQGRLFTNPGKSLILLGGSVAPTSNSTGEILIDGGRLGALGGRVEIGGLNAPGSVKINVDGNNLSLSFPDSVARTDISLTNNSDVLAFGANGGDIVVNANNFNLLNDSVFFAGILPNQGTPDSKAGDISIKATGIVTLADSSGIGNLSPKIGDGGNINILAQSLQITNGSNIQSRSIQSNSGAVNIKVNDTFSVFGTNESLIPSGILSDIINIEARKISLADGSLISIYTSVINRGGMKIKADDSINLNNSTISRSNFDMGNTGDISLITNSLNMENNSQISGSTSGLGNSSNININANKISIDNSGVFASAFSFPEIISNIGNAGDINIVTQQISITNRGSISSASGEPKPGETIGGGGNINITATELIEIDAKGATDKITGFNTRTFSSSRAGDITLNTKNLIIRDGGSIRAEAANNLGGNAGNITINASDSVQLISSNRKIFSLIFTGIEAFKEDVIAEGNGGDLTIITRNLQLTNGVISAATYGKGNAGNITILSDDGVIIDDSLINNRVGAGAVGNAGDINIKTRRLTLTNGGQIDAGIAPAEGGLPGGQGKGRSIRINATDAVTILGSDADGFNSAIFTQTQKGAFGQGGDIIINTDYFRAAEEGIVSASTENSSNGGNITINARVFELYNGGSVITGTLASGQAGNITINATDKITISTDTNLDGTTGVLAGTNSSGNGGTISLFTTDFNLLATNSNFPIPVNVSTRSQGGGIAGDINIVATGNYNANNALVSARAEQSGGGNINVFARNINLRNNSDIRTDLSSGNAKGGNIFLSADNIIALEDSDILAFAPEGQGGNITFNTRAVFSDSLYQTRQTSTDRNSLQSIINNSRSDINASGAISGNIIGVPDISFIQNSLTELQNNPIDTNALIANSCIARSPKQEGTFIITGTGGLPNRPGEAMASSYSTGDVQSVTNNIVGSSWKKGDGIVEPQGVYRLANGDLVMSRECN